MMNWQAIQIWAAIILLLDAAFGMWNHERFAKWAPKINVLRIAWIEVSVAVVLIAIHFWMRQAA